MNDIIGHERILDFFHTVMHNGRLSHAYCLIGGEHVGKRRIVEEISAELLQISREKLATIPDYFVVAPSKDEKTGIPKRDIDVDAIRELRIALSRFSFLGGWKIAVIDGIEKLNQSSANALLKTLEEPTEKTILFLLGSHDDTIPATVLSRCQNLSVAPVKKEIIQAALESRGVSRADAEERARHSRGLPGLALLWTEDIDLYEQHKKEVLRFDRLIGQSFFDKIRLTAELVDGEEAGAVRERLDRAFEIWSIAIRDAAYAQAGMGGERVYQLPMQHSLGLAVILRVAERLREARQYIWKNISSKMVLESVLLEIP